MDPEKECKQRLGAIKKNKEKWQRTYQKYKDKYYESNLEFEDVNAQSTPKLEIIQKKDEKGSQTSMIKIISKSTQSDESPPALPPRKSLRSVTSILEHYDKNNFFLDTSQSQKNEDQQSLLAETVESFSYVHGSDQYESTPGESLRNKSCVKAAVEELLTIDSSFNSITCNATSDSNLKPPLMVNINNF